VLTAVLLKKVPAWACTRMLSVHLAVKLVSIYAFVELRSGCMFGQEREIC